MASVSPPCSLRTGVRPLLPIALVALVVTLLPSGALVPASAATPASTQASGAEAAFAVPGDGKIVVRGRGYGHGHGMSQYGAQGAATQGIGWKRILRFYYPGVKRGKLKTRVRVLISADTGNDVVVDPRKGLRARSVKRRKTHRLPNRVDGATVKRWRMKAGKAGRTVVAHRSGGRWHRWWRFRGEGRFGAGASPIRLHHPGGSTRYRGRLALAGGARDTVNVLSLEKYVRGVVPREIPASWHPHAVRAQAVAARTYAAFEMRHPKAGHYQLCDTSSCQVYGGYDAEHRASNAAVKATRHQILVHKGAPAFTQFSSSSGGWTAANQFPYLPAQKDPWDDWAGNPVHTWRVRIPARRISNAWPALGKLKRIRVTKRNGHGAWGGRVTTMVLVGTKGRVRVSGDTFRLRLGLRSNWFTFRAG